MNQATFLISRKLIAKYPELRSLSGMELTERLHKLLKDPLLWKKISLLKSKKYTKQYQAQFQFLKRVYFYPYPEDWCFLSILSNGTGFSRCYIFIHLLKYDIGEEKLENNVTPIPFDEMENSEIQKCSIELNLKHLTYRRENKTHPPNRNITPNPKIHLKKLKLYQRQ